MHFAGCPAFGRSEGSAYRVVASRWLRTTGMSSLFQTKANWSQSFIPALAGSIGEARDTRECRVRFSAVVGFVVVELLQRSHPPGPEIGGILVRFHCVERRSSFQKFCQQAIPPAVVSFYSSVVPLLTGKERPSGQYAGFEGRGCA
jgi:hypothetical protein